MKFFGYAFIVIAVLFFVADLIEVTYLKDYLPWIDYKYKGNLCMCLMVLGIVLLKVGNAKGKS